MEAYQEWADATFINPIPDDFFLTDSIGTVFYDEFLLADQGLGFQEDGLGDALLFPEFDQDQAFVLLEVDAPGFTSRLVEVELNYDFPDAFVSVPFN